MSKEAGMLLQKRNMLEGSVLIPVYHVDGLPLIVQLSVMKPDSHSPARMQGRGTPRRTQLPEQVFHRAEPCLISMLSLPWQDKTILLTMSIRKFTGETPPESSVLSGR
jgi:hypothetical protein